MNDTEIKVMYGVFALLGGLILFAIWQLLNSRKPEDFEIKPSDIGPFKPYEHKIKDWYVSRPRFWPPVKFNQDRDRCGKNSIYKNNQELVGEIKIFNSYNSFLEFSGHEIHSVADLQTFTNFVNKIDFIDKPSNNIILTIKPQVGTLGLSFNHVFDYKNNHYRFKTQDGARWIAELYRDQVLIAVFCVATTKQINAAITLDDVDSGVLMLCFDIFRRISS